MTTLLILGLFSLLGFLIAGCFFLADFNCTDMKKRNARNRIELSLMLMFHAITQLILAIRNQAPVTLGIFTALAIIGIVYANVYVIRYHRDIKARKQKHAATNNHEYKESVMRNKFITNGELKDKKIVAALQKAAVDYENGEIAEVQAVLEEIVEAINEFDQEQG